MRGSRFRRPLSVAGFMFVLLGVAAAAGAQNPHADLSYTGPGMCLGCHEDEAIDVHGSVMYQWQGDAPDMATGPPVQGKISGGVNSYCINILGNWDACGNCHIGLGALPEAAASPEQLANIDCLLCHQEQYRRVKVAGAFVPDTANMAITMDQAVQTVHLPKRSNCLQCHAKAGGGDAVKRGDLAMAHVATSDSSYDVHMATTGANLVCQSCHVTTHHRVAGRGSDLRPSDSDFEMGCTNCHLNMSTSHPGTTNRRHLERVACQSCHIPTYAKNASDTPETEATETHRTWLATHSASPPYHPAPNKGNDLIPVYRFWNGDSHNALLYDVASTDPITGRYPTSRPLGHPANLEAKLYPFKYKTAEQPITNDTHQLIALDTSVFFATADAAAATEQGLVNMGFDPATSYSWIETDTLQLLNHQVSPSSSALGCDDCHGSGARLDLPAQLGYRMWGSQSQVCRQCHGNEPMPSFETVHNIHVSQRHYDCSWCHSFSRPERNLTMPNGVLFRDGLETGDTYAWSDAEPR
jgi:hypothetical protein